MRFHILSIVAIVVLVTTSLFSACVSPFGAADETRPVNVSPTINVGISPVDTIPEEKTVRLQDAITNFKDSVPLSLNTLQNEEKILFIRGGNLDASGKADYWVFGVAKGSDVELRIYDYSGWTIAPWNASVSAKEINLETIQSPETVLEQTESAVLKDSPTEQISQRDIELKDDVYTITLTSGTTTRSVRINATTGAALE